MCHFTGMPVSERPEDGSCGRFPKFNLEKWAQLLGYLNFKGHFEVKMSNASGN